MDTAAIVTSLIQLGVGVAAWRLANEVKGVLKQTVARIDHHEGRIAVLETRKTKRK